MSVSLWNGDLHVHTNLSFCAPQTTVPESYLPYLDEEDIQVIGFSNHLYPASWIRGSDPEKRPGLERNLRIIPELEEMRRKTNAVVLLGCEIEVIKDKPPTLLPEEAGQYDYVLLAASHVMNIYHEYEKFNIDSADKLRDMTLDRYFYACSLDYPVPTGICHPLYALCSPWEQEVVDGISDSVLSDCFSLAAKKGISIEIHACLYREGTAHNEEGLSPSYLRVLSAAKACGCKFHFGSDAHAPGAFTGKHRLLRRAAEIVGITKADMWHFPALDRI